MPEGGDSSRKPNKGKFGLFHRAQQKGRLRNASDPEQRIPERESRLGSKSEAHQRPPTDLSRPETGFRPEASRQPIRGNPLSGSNLDKRSRSRSLPTPPSDRFQLRPNLSGGTSSDSNSALGNKGKAFHAQRPQNQRWETRSGQKRSPEGQTTKGDSAKGQAKNRNPINPFARWFGKKGKPTNPDSMQNLAKRGTSQPEADFWLEESLEGQSKGRPFSSPGSHSGLGHSGLRFELGRGRERSSAASRSEVPSPAPRSSSVLPFSRRGKRLETTLRSGRFSRSPETRLQAEEFTLLQRPTSLQEEATLLQDRNLSDANNRRPRSRRHCPEPVVPVRPRSRSVAISLYVARMLILSIGIGVLAGTVLSAWNPASSPFVAASTQGIKQASSVPGAPAPTNSGPSQLQLTQEIAPLKAKLEALLQQYSGFTPGVFLLDLDSNNYLDLSGTHSFAAASTIKVPILIALFQEVDAGKIRLDEKLTLTKEMIAQGSGDMQYLQPGSQFTVLDVATKMIIISDNTATNMLIARLGGLSALNQRFNSWGLTETILNSVLPDLKGTNVTSPKELTSLMVRVSQGDLVSLRSRDRILDIMRRTVNNSQLPQGLGEGATIAHKTGDIGTLIGDVGLVDMPNGKRYVATVLVKRAFNDDRAYDLIQKISRTIYQHLSGSATVSDAISTPSPSAAAGAQSSQADADPGNTEAQHSPHHPITPEQAPSHSNPMQASTQQ